MVNSMTCMNIGTSLEKAIKSVYQIIRRSLLENNLKNTKSLANYRNKRLTSFNLSGPYQGEPHTIPPICTTPQ